MRCGSCEQSRKRRANHQTFAPTDRARAEARDEISEDLTDDEWAYAAPLIPSARRGGGKQRTERHIPNSIATMRRSLIIALAAAAMPVLSKSNANMFAAGKFVTQ
jgi:hypothetical protein